MSRRIESSPDIFDPKHKPMMDALAQHCEEKGINIPTEYKEALTVSDYENLLLAKSKNPNSKTIFEDTLLK